MTKYNCELCSYHTHRKSDYTRHLSSNRHKIRNMEQKQNISKKIPADPGCPYTCSTYVQKYQQNATHLHVCPYCSGSYEKMSNLTRHIPKCPMKTHYIEKYLKEVELRKKESELRKIEVEKEAMIRGEQEKRIKQLEHKIEELHTECKTSKDDLISTTKEMAIAAISSTNNKSNPNFYSFVAGNYNKTQPLIKIEVSDVPQLNFLKVILDEKDGELELCEVLQHHVYHETTGNFFGDFIVGGYVETDKSKQKFFNTDFSRLNYLVRDTVDDVPTWRVDKKGLILAAKIITPILDYINDHLKKHSDAYLKMTMKKYPHSVFIPRNNRLLKLQNDIDSGKLTNKILRYIAPHFIADKETITKVNSTKAVKRIRKVKRKPTNKTRMKTRSRTKSKTKKKT